MFNNIAEIDIKEKEVNAEMAREIQRGHKKRELDNQISIIHRDIIRAAYLGYMFLRTSINSEYVTEITNIFTCLGFFVTHDKIPQNKCPTDKIEYVELKICWHEREKSTE